MVAAAVAMAGLLAGAVCLLVATERQRRRRLNGSLHELRRPAQILALMAGREQLDRPAVRGCLDQLALGLDDLDRELNGGSVGAREPVSASSIARSAESRWGWSERVEIELGEDALADVDPSRLGAALDNLVANSLEHGAGRVRIHAGRDGERVAFSVDDEGAAPGPGSAAVGADPRRGHGERVISRTVADQGGSVARAGSGHLSGAIFPLAGGR